MSNYIGEIILHGKTNSGCHKATDGLDPTFVNFFTECYFKESEDFEARESFIVEARLWKDVWYGVYTLMFKGVVDTANRGSFVALSIVCPNNYYCLTSDVYNAMRKVFNDYIIGKYLSTKGKFIVNDFGDKDLFNGLIEHLCNGWVNLQEPFDKDFIRQDIFPSDVKYNFEDCDSKAFIRTLRQKGRIIVSDNAPSKDEMLANVEYGERQITELNKTIQRLEGEIDSYKKKEGNSQSTKNKLENLKQENYSLKDSNAKLKQQIGEYSKKFKNIVNDLNEFSRLLAERFPNKSECNPQDSGEANNSIAQKSISKKWLPWAVIIALVVSVAAIFFMGHTTDNGSPNTIVSVDTIATQEQEATGYTSDSLNRDEDTSLQTETVEYTISIKGYPGYGKLKVGKNYTLEVNPTPSDETSIMWDIEGIGSSDFRLDNNQLTLHKAGAVTIRCIVGGSTVERTIEVENKTTTSPNASSTKVIKAQKVTPSSKEQKKDKQKVSNVGNENNKNEKSITGKETIDKKE